MIRPVYRIIVDLKWGNVCSMNGGDNDAYGFGTIDFNALMVETIC